MRRKKKGSLNLSINAIVVLILAVTMLGLGLGFMKTMFAKAVGQFEDVSASMKEQLLDDLKSTDERIALNVFAVDMRKGDTKKIYLGVKNDLEDTYPFKIFRKQDEAIADINEDGSWNMEDSLLICYNSFDLVSGEQEKLNKEIKFKSASSVTVPAGDVKVFSMDITASSSAKLTTYSCSLIIKDPLEYGASDTENPLYARKDFEITVN